MEVYPDCTPRIDTTQSMNKTCRTSFIFYTINQPSEWGSTSLRLLSQKRFFHDAFYKLNLRSELEHRSTPRTLQHQRIREEKKWGVPNSRVEPNACNHFWTAWCFLPKKTRSAHTSIRSVHVTRDVKTCLVKNVSQPLRMTDAEKLLAKRASQMHWTLMQGLEVEGDVLRHPTNKSKFLDSQILISWTLTRRFYLRKILLASCVVSSGCLVFILCAVSTRSHEVVYSTNTC